MSDKSWSESLPKDWQDQWKTWSGNWQQGWAKIAEEVKNALWKSAKSWTVGWLDTIQLWNKFEGKNFEEGKDYVEIRLVSMRIPYETVGIKKFYATLHSYLSLDTSTAGIATFNAVTTPTQLQNVDPTNLSNVINQEILLAGPVPYIGGDINIQAGVFSIVEDNLLAPFLQVIESISKAAGVSIVGQAIPFVEPIENAIYHLVGYDKDNKLEIGINMALEAGSIKEGYLVAVGASPSADYKSKLYLRDDGILLAEEKEITKVPYMVLSVKAKKHRDPYILPDVKTALESLREAIKTGSKDGIDTTFKNFECVVSTSPDLLTEDAQNFISNIKDEYKIKDEV